MIDSLQDILEELGVFFCLQSKVFAPFFVCCFCISVKLQLVYYLFCNRRLKPSFFENQLFQSAPYLQHLIAFHVHLHIQCRKKFPVSSLHCRRREKKKKGLLFVCHFFSNRPLRGLGVDDVDDDAEMGFTSSFFLGANVTTKGVQNLSLANLWIVSQESSDFIGKGQQREKQEFWRFLQIRSSFAEGFATDSSNKLIDCCCSLSLFMDVFFWATGCVCSKGATNPPCPCSSSR